MHTEQSYDTLAQDTDAIANDVTAASGVAFTLITDEMSDGCAHKVIITPSGSVTGNYAITGKGFDGASISETLATNTTNAVTSTNYFLSDIVVKAPSGMGAETVDIGYTAAALSPPIHVAQKAGNMASAMGISVDATGTPAYSLQQSYGGQWYAHATIATKTASADGSILFPVNALRLIFTAASVVEIHIQQAGQ
jgi:hypothetical protein